LNEKEHNENLDNGKLKRQTFKMQLEGYCNQHNINPRNFTKDDIDKASAIFAKQARGNVYVIKGEFGRSDSTWNGIERDIFAKNKNINKDIEFIDPYTRESRFYDKQYRRITFIQTRRQTKRGNCF